MLESFNYDRKELRATNRYLQNYIDSCHKESEIRAAYPEQSTAHFEIVANIAIISYNAIPQEKQNESEKYFQENPYDGNEANNGIEVNANKTI